MLNTVDTKKAMLQALEKNLGIVTVSAAEVGISRAAHYLWMNNDAEYRAQVESIDDIVLDTTESALHKNIKAGDTTAIIFHLKTKGRKRGYIERVDSHVTTTYENMTEEEIEARLAELKGETGDV